MDNKTMKEIDSSFNVPGHAWINCYGGKYLEKFENLFLLVKKFRYKFKYNNPDIDQKYPM